MGLAFCDSFDHYATSQITRKWTGQVAGASIVAGAGRSGGALRTTNNAHVLWKTVAAQGTFIIGMAVNWQGGGGGILWALLDSPSSSDQVCVNLLGTGLLQLLRGNHSGTVLGTTSSGLTAGVWAYVEVKVLISTSAGTVDVHINGQSVLSLTGQNTQAASATTADTLILNGEFPGAPFNGLAVQVDYDDLYICDLRQGINNNFLGDVSIQCLYPTANGTLNQFAVTGATNAWQACNDATPNDDTSYVETPGVGNTQEFAHAAITASTVFALQSVACARKTGTGTRSIAGTMRTSSLAGQGAGLFLSTSYACYCWPWDTDPATGLAWTVAAANSSQFGVVVAS
jgi:hypothetical protein